MKNYFGFILALCVSCNVFAEENSENYTDKSVVMPQNESHTLTTEEKNNDISKLKTTRVWTTYVYDWISCNPGKGFSAWCDTDRKGGPIIIEAEPNWQACRFVASEDIKMGRAGWEVRKDRVVPDDTQQPPRFRAYNLHLWAYYANDNATAKILLKNVGIKMIPFTATAVERAREGCDL